MGQKVSPLLMRIGYIKNWRSVWFADKNQYTKNVQEDYKVRKFIRKRFEQAAISRIEIERLADKTKIIIYTARPGVIIGRRGADIDRLKEELGKIVTLKEVAIEPREIKNPNVDAQLIAQNIAFQLEKRVAFRRAVKRAMEQAMQSGAKGIKVSVAGRLNGAEMSRREKYLLGKLPLHTLRADVDYGFAEAHTTYGLLGVKVWVYNGDVILERSKFVKKAVPVEAVVNAGKGE
ncbi:MAG: 30S ribosomal protein S3 [Omnitrophica WOR_2 bacterium RIFCSPHIGHO2_01_FULL_48_9]|nr:MAG: 30S ribosomal protein S3 [Omnitrophica WOR_2 bacterium RIFCSPHIGHO2_02_FULL_48_11]OGX33316.1 MAG: 30S ribosomal protein S3 [Omnitrophica WOR_2 bacterium RIFCSPHIGHO2_01_FULL_48_9]